MKIAVLISALYKYYYYYHCSIKKSQIGQLDVTCCVRLHTLLHVVVCCCAKFETAQTFSPVRT